MIRIREVDTRDTVVAEDIADLHKVCFAYAAERVLTDVGYWWLGYDGEDPVCFAGLWPSQNWPMAGYFCRAGVLRECRGQGLQSRLIHARLRKARSLGWKFVVSDTNDNPHSANNLIEAGFRMFTPPKAWGPDGSVYWRKTL